jgi:hypothetical protein
MLTVLTQKSLISYLLLEDSDELRLRRDSPLVPGAPYAASVCNGRFPDLTAVGYNLRLGLAWLRIILRAILLALLQSVESRPAVKSAF